MKLTASVGYEKKIFADHRHHFPRNDTLIGTPSKLNRSRINARRNVYRLLEPS
jgi:hypothetical protein